VVASGGFENQVEVVWGLRGCGNPLHLHYIWWYPRRKMQKTQNIVFFEV
jgi:hypothetical protein